VPLSVRPQPVTSPLWVRPQLGHLAPLWDRSFGVSRAAPESITQQ
jgi:hypothetical protein